MNNKILHYLVVFLPFALPLYVVRFAIGPMPTTGLEMYILILLAVWLYTVLPRNPLRSYGASCPTSQLSHVTGAKDAGRATRDVRRALRLWFWPLVAWLAATLVAVFVAGDRWAAFGHWRAFMLEPVLIFIILNSVLHRSSQSSHVKESREADPNMEEARRGLFTSIAVVTILMGVYAIVQYATGWGIPSPWDTWDVRRATGTFGFPNGLSLFIVPFGVVSFILLMQSAKCKAQSAGVKLHLILFLSATLLAGIATVLAKSMGGILAFAIGVVLTLIVFKKTRLIGILLAVIGVLGSGFIAWQIIGTELHPQTIEDSLAASKKWSSSVRVIIWKESFEIIKAHPLLGTGLRSYQTAVAPYHEATWMEIYPHPHNIFLMLWIETGLAGLLAFIWLIGTWTSIVLPRNPLRSYGASCPTSQSSHVTGAKDAGRGMRDVRQLVWLIPLIVILVHGMVDMPYFKNDLAVQFFMLAAIATASAVQNAKLKMQN